MKKPHHIMINNHIRKLWLSIFLACKFCFPISDHVMVPHRTVFFKCRLMHVYPRAYVYIINEKANSLENIRWSKLGKQNIQGRKVCCLVHYQS